MPRVSRSKPKKQPAKKQVSPGARSPASKPAKAAPARQARKGKSAPRGAAKAKVARGAKGRGASPARARRAPRTAEVRAQVARPRPSAGATKAEVQAEHEHQDPRLSGVPGLTPEGDKVQTFNYGQFKNKAVARFDKPVNWFRRAPKPKQ